MIPGEGDGLKQKTTLSGSVESSSLGSPSFPQILRGSSSDPNPSPQLHFPSIARPVPKGTQDKVVEFGVPGRLSLPLSGNVGLFPPGNETPQRLTRGASDCWPQCRWKLSRCQDQPPGAGVGWGEDRGGREPKEVQGSAAAGRY